jgi:hypothetical protein
MTWFFSFVRSELFLSLAGGFALGLAGIALVKPASAGQEKNESRAVLIEGIGQGALHYGKIGQ